MTKIKIKKWTDLRRLTSVDKWGNTTCIRDASHGYVEIETHGNNLDYYVRRIRTEHHDILKGGTERVLEELKMCGFDVEFIEMPELSALQRLELEHSNKILGMEWIIIGRDGAVLAYKDDNKPTKEKDKMGAYWQAKDFGIKLKLNYDFLTFEDDEPWNIKELLSN